MKDTQKVFVISGPSGVGKSTVAKEVLKQVDDLELSVSTTTRKPREGEKEGTNYFFIEIEGFKEKIRRGDLVEWALVHGNYYGTLSSSIQKAFEAGKDVLLEIDVQGARQIRSKYPGAVLIFLKPPDFKILSDRLKSRKTESAAEVEKRIKNARDEMNEESIFGYSVVNDKLERTVKEVTQIIRNERGKTNC